MDLITVHPTYNNEEYERRGDDSQNSIKDDAERDKIYKELIAYCEKEMEVHKKSKDSTNHHILHNRPTVLRRHILKRMREANGKIGVRVDPTAQLLADMATGKHRRGMA